ncbi:CoA transferase [Glaciibacter psychrotolerans]
MLADFGADVIKIEHPAGDDTRTWRPPVDANGMATYFSSVNRGKRSIVCDLSTPEGLATATRLALSADIVIENFRPGTMERFGLGYAELSAQRPALVYCSITGFGAEAGAALPGYDLLVQAVGGLMSITGTEPDKPAKVGVALVDVLTGLNALVGIQAALRVRDSTGLGQRVEVNLLQSLLAGLVNQAASTLTTGVSPARLGNAHPSIAPYETLNAADRVIAIAVGNDRQFRNLTEVLELTDLADDPRFATNPQRVAHRDMLHDLLEARLIERPAATWLPLLAAAGVPAGPVNTVAEALELADELGLAGTATIAGAPHVVNPIRLSATPPTYRAGPPRLGEHEGAEWLLDSIPLTVAPAASVLTKE